jgi:hypothetical protein
MIILGPPATVIPRTSIPVLHKSSAASAHIMLVVVAFVFGLSNNTRGRLENGNRILLHRLAEGLGWELHSDTENDEQGGEHREHPGQS